MVQDGANEGIIVSGHASIRAKQMAVGRNASIVNAGSALEAKGLQEVRDKLERLFAAVSAHSGSVSERETLLHSTEAVAGELAKDKPNKLTVASILDGIAGAVKSVTSIVGAAEALKAAVAALL
jgi:hypothetical protein